MSVIKQLIRNLRFHAGKVAAPARGHDLACVSSQFRPYKGGVDEDLLVKVKQLAVTLESVAADDRSALEAGGLAIWVMVSRISSWVLDVDGMLQRNKLISKFDTALVRQWVWDMEEIGFRLLDQGEYDSKNEPAVEQ